MRHPYERTGRNRDVVGYRRIALEVIREALDEIGPAPGQRDHATPIALRLAVKLSAERKETIRWLVEDRAEVEAWCLISRLMTPQMVYAEARDRLAYLGFYEPRLDALAIQVMSEAA